MRLLIAIPSHDYIHVEFVKSLTRLMRELEMNNINFDVCIESGTLVYVARDNLSSKAINGGYTHVLWLDADMVFQETLLDDLQFCGKEFVCGVFHARRKGYHSCIFSNIDINSLERIEEYPREAFEIAGCGFACVYMSVDMLKTVMSTNGTCFLPTKNLGEDLAFCKRATDLGYKLYCEPSAVVGHMGHVAIYPEDHERWKEQLGLERG